MQANRVIILYLLIAFRKKISIKFFWPVEKTKSMLISNNDKAFDKRVNQFALIR